MSNDVRIGVLGLGHWGPNLARNLNAIGSLAAICDLRTDARTAASQEYPQATVHESPDSIITDPTLDAIVIATPAASHGEFVRRALEARKHVFVEKPLCLNVDEGESLKRLASAQDVVLMVGHLLLYHPAFRALQDLVAEGRLGDLRYVYSNRASLGKIRREENSLWSFAPHDISMILALTGAMPQQVSAHGSSFLTPGIVDITLTHMSFESGTSAHVFVSWLHPYKDHRMVVVGSKAMIVFNDVAAGAEKLLLYNHRVGWDGDVPAISKAEAEAIPYEETEPLRAECEAFLAAIRGNAHPPSNADEALRVLTVLNACQESLRSGGPAKIGKPAAP